VDWDHQYGRPFPFAHSGLHALSNPYSKMSSPEKAGSDALPHESLHQSLCKTKEIVAAVQNLQKAQEEADKKASKELKNHAQTREKIKQVEADAAAHRELMEKELRDHMFSKDQLEKAEREHNKTRDMLQAQRHEVSSMLLQMEALKVEMEAQRKAFVVNVNWAARCTDLKVKFDQSRQDYEKLWETNIQTKSALDTAKASADEYRQKSMSVMESLEIAREQLQKQTEEIAGRPTVTEAIAKDLEEWQKFKDAEALEKIEAQKGQSKAMGVLQRQLAQGDAGLTISTFTAWSTFVREDLKKRRLQDQAMKQAMKTIANEGMALVAQCFGPWKKEADDKRKAALAAANRKLEEANARSGGAAAVARKRALEQLEKQFIGQDKALTKQAFTEWANGKALRKKKDGNMQKGARMIANSHKAVQAEIFMLWKQDWQEARQRAMAKEAGNKKAARMIANSGKALVVDVFLTWAGYVKACADERKKKAAGNEKAARMMANSAGMLLNICFDSWGKLQAERKKKDAGNKKAARMMANSSQALIIAVWDGWRKTFQSAKAKGANTAKAVRMIAASNEAMQAATFRGWADYIHKNREKNKKLRAVEKTLGASAEGLKLLITTTWRSWSIQELRKKRGKTRSMTSALKSINSDRDMLMTQILMGWARVIAQGLVQKLQEKVAAAQKALDDAMITATKAVEEDCAKCQAEVERLTGELEIVKKQYEEAVEKAEALREQIANAEDQVAYGKQRYEAHMHELEDSKKKAQDISDELAKVGIFLQNATPRKMSRPRSGAKGSDKDGNALPKIGSAQGRPGSGSRRGNAYPPDM